MSNSNIILKKICLLYRHILKGHIIYLKEDMRVFGDYFVKTEFMLHYNSYKTDLEETENLKKFINQ